MKTKTAAGLWSLLILSACGGGGSDSDSSTPGPVAGAPPSAATQNIGASSTPATASPTATSTPASSTPASIPAAVTQAPAPIVIILPPPPPSAPAPSTPDPTLFVPITDSTPSPGGITVPVEVIGAPTVAPPPPQAGPPTVSKAAFVKALTTGFTSRFTSGDATDNWYTQLQTYARNTEFRHYTGFAPFGENQGMGIYTTITLGVAVGENDLTFTGAGAIRHAYYKQSGETPLVSAQYSIPARVPLNTPMLNEWKIQGTPEYVRLNVGDVGGHPEQMRVCWDTQAHGISSVSCTRHIKETGQPIGGDSVNEAQGRTYTHVTNDDAASPRRIHQCVRALNGTSAKYTTELFEFSDHKLYRNRTLFREFKQENRLYAGWTVTDLGGGLFEESVSDQGWSSHVVRRANAVDSFTHRIYSKTMGVDETDCSWTGGL